MEEKESDIMVEGSLGIPRRFTDSIIHMTMTSDEYIRWCEKSRLRIRRAQWRVRQKLSDQSKNTDSLA